MQAILSSTDNSEQISNKHINGKSTIVEENMNGIKPITKANGHHIDVAVDDEEKVALPVEMASMVPLRSLIAKLIHKSYADLMTLTDTLPSMSDVEKKRQILTHMTFVRKQFLKLLVLVKWAENANDIQMCQNIMAFLSNQNKIFQDTVDYLHKIHLELPAARLRNFDIPTAVDVLTTGTYQRMPTKIKDMLVPTPLTDEQVLETFQTMNDVIRMRMITTEVLPSPMQNYRIESGRIYFLIENEFEVALTLMGPMNNRRWWVVSLDMFVKATAERGAAEEVDINLTDMHKQHLRINAQQQLVPPILEQQEIDAAVPTSATNPAKKTSLFFPLVNLYDYLHLCCLNMQLEILYIQAAMLAKTRWINQLSVHMNKDRSRLSLTYWHGGVAAAHWARPHPQSNAERSTVVEIFISNEDENANRADKALKVRDDLTGLIQRSGIGASIALSDLSSSEKPKVYSLLNYPKNCFQVLWGSVPDLHTEKTLLDSSNLNIEQLVLHVTSCHSKCIIEKFRKVLTSQKKFLEENGLHMVEEDEDIDRLFAGSPSSCSTTNKENKPPSLIIRYRHQKYISIESDVRTGRVKAFGTTDGSNDGDDKLRGLEARLNEGPADIAHHLLWLRSEVIVREIVSLAKQLNLQHYHPSQMNLRPDDLTRLFGDVLTENVATYPSHCIFLQFPQFEDWYFVIATIKNEFKTWLCCINKSNDQSGIYQTIVDLTYLDCAQLWKDQFIGKKRDTKVDYALIDESHNNKRSLSETAVVKAEEEEEEMSIDGDVNPSVKRRRMSRLMDNNNNDNSENNKIDNLSIDLRYLAKLDSLCRAYIINRKIEFQLQSYIGSLKHYMRPLKTGVSNLETQVLNHPASDKMEVICLSQKDILKTCAYHYREEAYKQQQQQQPLEIIPWVEKTALEMKNDVVIRASGWWECGRGDCYVVIQDKLDWKNMQLEGTDLGDHVSLDKAAGIISFTYPNIDKCIDLFLMDWERIAMMANLSRQVRSKWFHKYKEQLEFKPTNLQSLTFTYTKDFTCTINWSTPTSSATTTRIASKSGSRQYNIELGIVNETVKPKLHSIPKANSRNPHWRIASFLRDILNEKRDLIYFVQILFQTLPLMACLERLETNCTQNGYVSKISIIPRAYDSVRVLFSAMNAAIDIRFTDKATICVSDAAYYHLFYTSRAILGTDTFVAPEPYTIQQQQQQGIEGTDRIEPIKVVQQFKFIPTEQFSDLWNTMESWIFSQNNDEIQTGQEEYEEEREKKWYLNGESWIENEQTEPSAVAFQHGLLCSASLCQRVLYKLQSMV